MNIEKYLENCVSETVLYDKGFHKKGHIMWKTLHEREIRFIEVAKGMYIFDGDYYDGKKIVEEREDY